MLLVYPRSKKWDVGISINGLPGRPRRDHRVRVIGSRRSDAIAIGAIAGVIMVLAVDFIEWLRVDDPIGAFAVHGACGIWGTLSLGLFAVGNYGRSVPDRPAVKGLFYGGGRQPAGRPDQGQRDRSSSATARRRAAPDVRRQGARRAADLAKQGELEGLDIHEHGAPAYHPEFAYMGHSAIPSNMEGVAPGLATTLCLLGHPPADVRLATRHQSPPPPGGCAVRSRAPRGSGSRACAVDSPPGRGRAGQE